MASAPLTQRVGDSVAKINDEVAIGEDLGFQRRWWRFERLVWILFVVIIVLDLAGAFGRGPLAYAEAVSPDHALQVKYERIERSGTPSMMTVTLDARTFRDGHANLVLSDSAVGGLGLRRVIPAPESTSVGSDRLIYRFPAGTSAAVVRFEFEPAGAGIYDLRVGIPDATSVRFRIAVVP